MPYTNEENVWQEVKNTGIHEIAVEDPTFILSVGLKNYTNYVFSAWVFIAVLYNEH